MHTSNSRVLTFITLAALALCAPAVFAEEGVVERAVPNTELRRSTIPTVPTLTIEQQVTMLRQQVQALQAQVAALQAIVKTTPTGGITFISNDTISLQAAKNISIGAGAQLTIQSNGTALVEGKGALDLKGVPLKLNGGTKPLATVGSQVQVPGQPIGHITTGGATTLGN